jgi:hypothetical protein
MPFSSYQNEISRTKLNYHQPHLNHLFFPQRDILPTTGMMYETKENSWIMQLLAYNTKT